MDSTSYTIVNNNLQFLCVEAYKRNISKLHLHSKSTKPCVWIFRNSRECNRYIDTFKKFKFNDVCVFKYENVNEKMYSPDETFIIHQNVTLTGILKKKNQSIITDVNEALINTKLTRSFADKINDLVYTQNLHLFVPKNVVPNIDELSNVSVSIEGVLLEPLFNNLENEEHLDIIIQNLNNSIIQS